MRTLIFRISVLTALTFVYAGCGPLVSLPDNGEVFHRDGVDVPSPTGKGWRYSDYASKPSPNHSPYDLFFEKSVPEQYVHFGIQLWFRKDTPDLRVQGSVDRFKAFLLSENFSKAPREVTDIFVENRNVDGVDILYFKMTEVSTNAGNSGDLIYVEGYCFDEQGAHGGSVIVCSFDTFSKRMKVEPHYDLRGNAESYMHILVEKLGRKSKKPA